MNSNGNIWKIIAAGIAIAGVAALWTGNARLASVETSLVYVTKQIEVLANETKQRLLALESARVGRFGGAL
jgi:hypothetical protein